MRFTKLTMAAAVLWLLAMMWLVNRAEFASSQDSGSVTVPTSDAFGALASRVVVLEADRDELVARVDKLETAPTPDPDPDPDPIPGPGPDLPPDTTPPPAEGSERVLLTAADLEYVGYVRVPRVTALVGTSRVEVSTFVKGGFAAQPSGVLTIAGHDHHKLVFGISTAEFAGSFGSQVGDAYDPTGGEMGAVYAEAGSTSVVVIGGLYQDWYALHNGFGADVAARTIGRRGGRRFGLKRSTGEHISQQRTGGYITIAPEWWASAHTGGRRILVGCTTRSIHGQTNAGPGLYAFSPDEADTDGWCPATVLSEFPVDPATRYVYPEWSHADRALGACFFDDGQRIAMLFSCRLDSWNDDGEGDGDGDGVDETWENTPYLQNPRGYHAPPYRAVLWGFSPSEIVTRGREARHRWEIDLGAFFLNPERDGQYSRFCWGVHYDATRGLLLVLEDNGGAATNGAPAVHAFRVRGE